MPITARLSREFYEKFGDKVVDELVALFNQVDTTYRTELREMNELNFARFDDKLERRLTEFTAELKAAMDRRFGEVDRQFGEQGRRIGDLRAELIKWMFIFWLGTVASTIGIVRALIP